MASIRISSLTKTFRNTRRALDDVSLEFASGEMVALIGASGSGKSTLLRHISGLLVADGASEDCCIEVDGRPIQRGGRLVRDVRRLRASIGFVFQQFNLVGRLSVITNVLVGAAHRMPLWRTLLCRFTAEEKKLALDALTRVGIGEIAWQRASTLSGGQQQRAAIARALVQRARLILADEPIASLDPESSRRVMNTLAEINRRDGTTVIVSLHQVEIALVYCPRVIALKDGRVMYDGPAATLSSERLREIYGSDLDTMLAPENITTASPPAVPVLAPINLNAGVFAGNSA